MWFLLAACRGPEGETSPPPKATDPEPSVLEDTAETTDTAIDTGTVPTVPRSALQFDGDPPENLIIVSLDTTRRDYIGRFTGNGNTPNLDRILAEGVSLDDHRSCSSWTGPSMTCVTTGFTPFDLDWWPWTYDPVVPDYDDDLPTLAWQLQLQKGYRTALVTSNTVFDQWLNLDRGFQTVLRPSWLPADAVTSDGLAAAGDLMSAGDPFYLHIHYVDPHASYCPPDAYVDQEDYIDLGADLCYDLYDLLWNVYAYADVPWRESFKHDLTELYDAEIEYWDTQFGRLLDGLDAMGALDDALLVFVTDHGEQFYERGALGHGLTLGAEENRAVAGFWAKNLDPMAWEGGTVHQDIAVTLQDLYGLAPPQPPSGITVGLAPEDHYQRGMLYWGPGLVRLSVVRGALQLTYDWWGEAHLYDHDLDEAGLIDYYDPTDPDVIALQPLMDDFIDEVYSRWPSAGEPVSVWP